MIKILPIKTTINGLTFRSRLEASWYLYFNQLGFDPEYEPCTFEINSLFGENLGKYLPDFYLHKPGCYVEVKPLVEEFSERDKTSLCRAYILGYKEQMAIVLGSPLRHFAVYVLGRVKGNPEVMKVMFENDGNIFNEYQYRLQCYPDENGLSDFDDPRGDCTEKYSMCFDKTLANKAWTETAWNI